MKHKTVRTAVAITVAAVAAVGVALFFLTRGEPTKTVTVVPVSNVYTSYWGDSKTLDGYVTTGSLQELYMTEGGFEKIVVKEGDRVRKGDVLVEYNNTQSELMLRGDLAKVNLLKSQITAFEQKVSKHYQEINRLEKVLEGEPTTPPTGGSSTAPTPTPVLTAHSAITDIAMAAVNKDAAGVGTTATPYRILATKDAVVKGSFWQTLPATGNCFVLDIYQDASCARWLARWTVTAPPLLLDTDWAVSEGLFFHAESGEITGFDASKLFAHGALTLVMPEELIEKFPTGEESTDIPMTKAEIEAEIKRLREEIDSYNRQIDTSKWDLRQAQITYEKNKMTQSAGKIVASIDGIVSTPGDISTPVGEVFLRVQGESRYAVTLYVNELMLREVRLGTAVQLMCYESGTMASAVITEIGTEPVSNYYRGGNTNASTYQVTAEITDGEAQPRLGEWCQATLDGQMPDQPSDTLYIPMYLIREDEGGEYVMRADEEERLQKQYITTGKTLWGSYTEIKSGVTMDDRLAFPYGKTVREGAPVVDGDYFV